MTGLSGRKVLVTGAGGFIGSHLAERLVDLGAEVTALVRYNALSATGNLAHGDPARRAAMRIAFGTVEDGDFLLRLAEGQDIVLHLAALIGIPYSYVSPRSYVATNVEGTLNVLEAARRAAVGRVVVTSTSEVYGTALYAPIDEQHPLRAQSPYAASKIAADKLAEAWGLSFSVPVVTLRPFNCYGPRQSPRAFIPTVILQALSRDTVMLGNLAPQRDMTFVADTVEAFVRAAVADGIEGETIHVGSGAAQSIGTFAEEIIAILGSPARIGADPARVRPEPSEVGHLVADTAKAARLLGWAPRVAFADGIRATADFLRPRIAGYDVDRYAI